MPLPASTQTHAADVIVIGGGFAGTWAALRAAETGASVILVDKAHVGRSGCSTMTGGVTTAPFEGAKVLKVDRRGIAQLSREAFHDIAHFLRPSHLKQLRGVMDDPESSENEIGRAHV